MLRLVPQGSEKESSRKPQILGNGSVQDMAKSRTWLIPGTGLVQDMDLLLKVYKGCWDDPNEIHGGSYHDLGSVDGVSGEIPGRVMGASWKAPRVDLGTAEGKL